MLALLETNFQQYSFYQRIKFRFGVQKNIEVFEDNILGMKILRVQIRLPFGTGPDMTLKNYQKVMEMLRRAGIGRVCFKNDFPMREEITDKNFKEPSDGLLWRMKGPEIAKNASPSGRSVFIATGDMKRDVSAAKYLSGGFRYIMLSSKGYQGDFCRYMCETTGISIIEKPGENERSKADAALVFEPEEKLVFKRSCIVVSDGRMPENVEGARKYVRDASFIYRGSQKFLLPEGFSSKDILSDAVTLGICKDSDIGAENVDVCTVDGPMMDKDT